MGKPKLLAEWFWIERWEGSSAAGLPMEARGLYREMLTRAWRQGGSLPADLEAVRRLVRCERSEWRRSWPLVEPYWRLQDGRLVPVEDLGGTRPLPGQSGHRPHIPLAVRRLVYERDGYACLFCSSVDDLSLDHIVAFSNGGSDEPDNLRVLCFPCNRNRGRG